MVGGSAAAGHRQVAVRATSAGSGRLVRPNHRRELPGGQASAVPFGRAACAPRVNSAIMVGWMHGDR